MTPTAHKETTKTTAPHRAAPRTHAVPAAHPAHKPAAHAGHAAPGRYTEAVGRRKTAVARVRLFAGSGKLTVNGKDAKHYFSIARLFATATAPFRELQVKDVDATVKVAGGGVNAQAEAVRHGIARAIVARTPDWKPRLRAMGYLTRDSRMVERKKYGLKKARRAPQWAKR